MIDQAAGSKPTGLRLGRRVIHQLRASLERDAGIQAATHLQEAGFAGGEELYQEFAVWLAEERQVDPPSDLDVQFLGETLSEFFQQQGWGKLEAGPLGPAVMAFDSENWAEALDRAQVDFPSCHLSCGLLADFLGRLSQGTVAVMEVECRSRGDARCRFLAGAPETLGILYDRMASGAGYLEALTGGGAESRRGGET
jgi:predicted hydrocarbon binding protein